MAKARHCDVVGLESVTIFSIDMGLMQRTNVDLAANSLSAEDMVFSIRSLAVTFRTGVQISCQPLDPCYTACHPSCIGRALSNRAQE